MEKKSARDIDHRTGKGSRSDAGAARRSPHCFLQTVSLIGFGSLPQINIADYEPLTTLLDLFKPLLIKTNPSVVIITEFQNWSDHISRSGVHPVSSCCLVLLQIARSGIR